MSCAPKSVVSRWQAPDERASRPNSYVSPTLSGHAICYDRDNAIESCIYERLFVWTVTVAVTISLLSLSRGEDLETYCEQGVAARLVSCSMVILPLVRPDLIVREPMITLATTSTLMCSNEPVDVDQVLRNLIDHISRIAVLVFEI